MGSYAECWLESMYLGSTKNHFDIGLMQLFRASDKKMVKCPVKDLPRPLRASRDDEDPNEMIDAVWYTAPAAMVKDRLELKGYTLKTARLAFMEWIRAEEDEYAHKAIPGVQEYHQDRLRILKALDVDQWMGALRHVKDADGGISKRSACGEYRLEKSLENFMLQSDWYGYSGGDLNVPLRLALEICSDKDNFNYDLTDLILQEYFDKDEDFVALASEFSATENPSGSKIIILTEGRSDGWILSKSMNLLYPHLSDHFTFMDFDLARVEGGASHLAKIVKSFTGAGIANKVIAIFDNDTAGIEAMRSLRRIRLPGNLRVLKLPHLKTLRRYPTIGPSGLLPMNVNGLAASIELYLGDDVLREGGELVPVQWRAYNPALGKYQGEVQRKDEIQRRFKKKLMHRRDYADFAHDKNWFGLRAIMASIFSAFHRYDQELILARQSRALE